MTSQYLEKVAEQAIKRPSDGALGAVAGAATAGLAALALRKPIAKGICAGAKMRTGKLFNAAESAAGKGVSEALAKEQAARHSYDTVRSPQSYHRWVQSVQDRSRARSAYEHVQSDRHSYEASQVKKLTTAARGAGATGVLSASAAGYTMANKRAA